MRNRLVGVLGVTLAAVAACAAPEGGVPRRIVALLAPPPGFIARCQDSARPAGGAQRVCNSAGGQAQWSVRLDARSEVLELARYQRVEAARASSVLDSLREVGRARLDEGDPCQAGYGHSWHRSGWATYVTAQPSELGGDSVTVVMAAARSPKPVPC